MHRDAQWAVFLADVYSLSAAGGVPPAIDLNRLRHDHEPTLKALAQSDSVGLYAPMAKTVENTPEWGARITNAAGASGTFALDPMDPVEDAFTLAKEAASFLEGGAPFQLTIVRPQTEYVLITSAHMLDDAMRSVLPFMDDTIGNDAATLEVLAGKSLHELITDCPVAEPSTTLHYQMTQMRLDGDVDSLAAIQALLACDEEDELMG